MAEPGARDAEVPLQVWGGAAQPSNARWRDGVVYREAGPWSTTVRPPRGVAPGRAWLAVDPGQPGGGAQGPAPAEEAVSPKGAVIFDHPHNAAVRAVCRAEDRMCAVFGTNVRDAPGAAFVRSGRLAVVVPGGGT